MQQKLENKFYIEHVDKTLWHIGQNDESFSIAYYVKKPYKHPRMLHYHDFYELEFILDGNAVNYINGTRFDLHRGMMFLTRPTDVHRYEIAEGEQLRVCTVRFSSALLRGELISALSTSALLVSDFSQQFDFIQSLLTETKREYGMQDAYSQLLFSDTVIRLSVMLLRAANSDVPDGHSALAAQNRIVSAVVSCINAEFGQHITVQRMAERFDVSPNYLGRLFHESMNMTLGQYLKRVRLVCALNRVVNTEDTLQRIALDCGFSSQSIFTREFRKYYGCSPVCLRRNTDVQQISDISRNHKQ